MLYNGGNMFVVFFLAVLVGSTQSDYLNTIKQEQDQGATWHYTGGQTADPSAQQLFNAETIYWKLQYEK